MDILKSFSDGRKKVAVLIDPDNYSESSLKKIISLSSLGHVAYYFVGGSLLHNNKFEETITFLKSNSCLPVVIFPGSSFQVSKQADAILFLSLVSGRNPEYLIGQQVVAAPAVKNAGIEVIPTAYLLIDGGKISTTAYITQTLPIPAGKPQIAVTTALAAYYMGMKAVYLEAGSGAKVPVYQEVIAAVKKEIPLPLIVGGGISSSEQLSKAFEAGADVVVIGNALEENPELLKEFLSSKNNWM
ncbi:MAG: geranylgeranylglyceryl/heptaprenylglyceryl phosphate synthase [Chitinophagales bacterium]|nr:geranylgeranylglyceryl/heptaprenylglyceryl phosphate synthase [Chitinophagales bacterium]